MGTIAGVHDTPRVGHAARLLRTHESRIIISHRKGRCAATTKQYIDYGDKYHYYRFCATHPPSDFF